MITVVIETFARCQ